LKIIIPKYMKNAEHIIQQLPGRVSRAPVSLSSAEFQNHLAIGMFLDFCALLSNECLVKYSNPQFNGM